MEFSLTRATLTQLRNTDNAWIESTVVHCHAPAGGAFDSVVLQGGDDAADAAWCEVTEELCGNMHAAHGPILYQIKRSLESPTTQEGDFRINFVPFKV